MIQEVTISNYKGIKTCQIKDLQKVNLFIGKNDSGKSSILEAIFHTCHEFVNAPNLHQIMLRRTNVFTGGREIWYGYDNKQPIEIALRFGDYGIRLRLSNDGNVIQTYLGAERRSWNTREKGIEYTIDILSPLTDHSSAGADVIRKMYSLKPPMSTRLLNLMEYLGRSVLIDCRSKAQLSTIESNLGQIKLDLKDTQFGNVLGKIYGKGTNWEFLPHPDSPTEKRIAFVEGQRRYFLSDFGDGFRFGLSMCATAMTMHRSAIFIEEIENHQHSGSLKQLIYNIVDIARSNDIQLFITTHSDDVWNSFSRGLYKAKPKMEEREFRCILVERDIESGVVEAEATNNLQKIVKTLGQA